MKKTKHILALILIAAMLLGISACRNSKEKEKETEQTEEESVTLTIFHSGAGALPAPILDNPVMNEIEERIGVKLDFSPFMGSGDPIERATMLIASNELPDIFLLSDTTLNLRLIENKKIIPLDNLVQSNGKDIIENVSHALDYVKTVLTDDQNTLYFIPAQVNAVNFYPSGYDLVYQYRWDLFKKTGMPPMENLDDFFEFCVKAQELEPVNKDGKKNYAVGMPLADGNGIDYIDWNIAHLRAVDLANIYVSFNLREDKPEARFKEGSPFMEGLEFYNRLYRAGLFDPDSATMTINQTQEKGQSMRYHVGLANWQIGWPNSILLSEKDTEKGFVPTLLDADREYAKLMFGTPYGNGMQYSISSSCKYPEKAMDFINYTASWDGAQLMTNGPEGNGYKFVNGIPVMDPYDPDAEVDPDHNKKIGIAYVAPLMIVNGGRDDPRGFKSFFGQNDSSRFFEGLTEAEKDFCNTYDLDYPIQIFDEVKYNALTPSLFFMITPKSDSDVIINATTLHTIASQFSIKMIYSKTDSDFNKLKAEFYEQLDANGYQEGVNWYIEQYKDKENLTHKLEEKVAPTEYTDTVRINFGGEEYIDMSGNTWEASKMYTSGSYGAQNGNLFTIESDIENTDKPELYQTMLYDNPIRLKFDNLTPGKYKVKLYMIEPVFNDPAAGGRVLDILINGKTYVKDVNMGKSEGFMTAYEPEFIIEVKQDEELTIAQIASVDMGVYCAVEITPAGNEALTTPLD